MESKNDKIKDLKDEIDELELKNNELMNELNTLLPYKDEFLSKDKGLRTLGIELDTLRAENDKLKQELMKF